jgi:hypothetical protein
MHVSTLGVGCLPKHAVCDFSQAYDADMT